MLRELENIEEITEFFDELRGKPFGVRQQAIIYGMAKQYQDITDKEKEYHSKLGDSKRQILETTLIGTDIAIIEVIEKWGKKDDQFFYIIVNGRKLTEVSNTLDQAIIIALSNKYGFGSSAPEMIYNMLRMDLANKEDVGNENK